MSKAEIEKISPDERQHLSRLLIVEDNVSQLNTITDIMTGEGFDVIGCTNAAEAIDHCQSVDFGVAIVDLRLPDLSGTQLLRKIKELNQTVNVIINTGHGSYDSAKESVQLGAFSYLEKLSDPALLVRQVHLAFRDHFNRYTGGLESIVLERTKQLRISEGKFRSIFENAAAGVVTVSSDGHLMNTNPKFCEFIGYTQSELRSKTITDITHPDDLRESAIIMNKLLSGHVGVIDREKRYIRKDGKTVWGHVSASAVREDDSDAVTLVGVVQDVTERVEAETKLQRSTLELKALFEAIPDQYFRINREGTVLSYKAGNEAQMLDAPLDLIGQRIQDRMPPEVGKLIDDAILEMETTQSLVSLEFALMRPLGERWFEARFFPLTENEHVMVIRDVTENKRAEEQLRDSSKMEALGHFVAGTAHEINNPLSVIAGNAQYLQELLQTKETTTLESDEKQELIEGLNLLHKNAMRCGAITAKLLAFSRGNKNATRAPIDINDSIRSVLAILRHQIELSNIETTVELSELPDVLANEEQMQQVFMNIIMNAWQAMDGAGKLSIWNHITIDNRVAVHIEDNGVGIKESDLHHVLEPFFTTKPIGQGTGLGLSVCYSILKDQQGDIKISSTHGRGTKITILLQTAQQQKQFAAMR